MKLRDILYNKVWRRAIVLLLAVVVGSVAANSTPREALFASFTKEKPLVIVTLKNNAPYEFFQPDKPSCGYNVDVVTTIADRLGINYQFRAMDWAEAKAAFENGEAHLIMVPEDVVLKGNPVVGQSILAPIHVAVAYNKETMGELEDFSKILNGMSLFAAHTGVALKKIVAAGIDTSNIEYAKTKDILEDLYGGTQGYMLGNEFSMAYCMRTNSYSNLSVMRLPVSSSGVRFCSYNSLLVNILDEELGRMEETGALEDLQAKWFYPERSQHDYSTIGYILSVAFGLLLILVFVLNRFMMTRTRRKAHSVNQATGMMKAAIDLDERNVICFDFKEMIIKNVSGTFLPEEGVLPEQYLDHVHPDDRPLVFAHMHHLRTTDSTEVFSSPVYRWSPDGNPDGPWRTVMLQSVFEVAPDGSHSEVVSTVSDITDDLADSKQEAETSHMFENIFNNELLGMAIYSPDGELIESNDRMSKIFHITVDGDRHGGYFYGNNLYRMPSLQGVLDPVNPQELWVCSRIRPGDVNAEAFIELHVTPVRYDDKLRFLLVSVRDITDDVNTYRLRKKEQNELELANQHLRQREDELRVLLQSARMRLWTVSERNRTISFYHSPGAPERVMTWEEFLSHAADEENRDIMQHVLQNDTSMFVAGEVRAAMNNLLGVFDTTQWYALNILGYNPADEYGEKSIFGLCLNITASVNAQRSFEVEKQRATESEHQKTVFLNSMAHEIRTPLNSIVGFSEVLPMLEGEEREMIITTIKQNCDKLLRLTDDILTISAMDAKELKFNYEDIDFAKAFDEEYENLRIYTDQNANVEYLKDNPFDSLMVRIDMSRISQILTNFLGNAVKYTSKGYIKLGYTCTDQLLRIYCQDTGTGISKERQKAVFERFFQVDSFVQGTGMGLSVCKAIAEAMGGSIGVESIEGEGSTFYVDIPQNGGGVILL